MAGLNEVSGLALIERISKEFVKRESEAQRIWSRELRCWGFFGGLPTDLDKTVVIGAAHPGDMILPDGCIVWKPISDGKWEPYKTVPPQTLGVGVVIHKEASVHDGNSILKLSFLLSGEETGVYDIFVQQSIAFKVLWPLMR